MIQYKNNEDYTLQMFILLGEVILFNIMFDCYRAILPMEDLTDIFHHRRVHGLLTLLYVICNRYSGYEVHSHFTTGHRILRNVLVNQLLFVVTAMTLIYAVAPEIYRWWDAPYMLISLTVVMTGYRKIMRVIIQHRRAHRKTPYTIVLVADTTQEIQHLFLRMQRDKTIGYTLMGYFALQPDEEFEKEGIPYLGTTEQAPAWLEANPVKEVYCALGDVWDNMMTTQIIPLCEHDLTHIKIIPHFHTYHQEYMTLHLEGDCPVFYLRNNPLMIKGNKIIKRTFDLLMSGIFLITIFPFVYLIFGLIIKLSSPGPVFFKQKRSGLDGKVFEMYKFRSMKVNSESDTRQATKDDDRKTRIGNFMRRTSIDELPQFINVFLGNMSIVGPRPHMVAHTEQYSELVSHYMVRHFVKPGITGYAQVTGFRGETDELWKMEGRVQADIWYLEHWSPFLDLWIIMRTVFRMKDAQAY